ncbi:hypothetical protein VC83_06108 [Pseudogymnoascus destructans]|uniref:Acid phosphatase pho5 n=1 Tax=Pseudogymnoascus destructans TaxID=655981 RepID=A0A177AAG5_9PEZI|nr:uncharacterized protein VC83_06108 [Pseudogymnoascus destructans]OAF58750.1 hypothetical protein VC83_06108 [Pseudogymnoascus destructans]
MSFPAFGAFLLVLLAIILISAIVWIVFIYLRARRLGLPTPTLTSYNPFASRSSYTPQPRSGGLIGWISDKFRNFRSRRSRTAGGAYEEPLGAYGGAGGGGARSGFGALDPDEAWDARVGNEADYYREEQEVGLHAETGYSGAGGEERGRTRGRRGEEGPYGGDSQRELDRRYEEEMGGEQTGVVKKSGGSESRNPFDDSAAVGTSLRGVSPRPDKGAGHDEHEGLGADPDSPTGKRSLFREVM